jgi:3-oxoadipate enol-lactonase
VASERDLVVNGIDLHLTEAGEGEPVLLIHGVTVDATFEAREIEALARTHRVVAPDLRGHGRSTRPERFTLEDHVADMIGLLDALGIERTAVVGASMGSYVAQGLALAVPERITRLVLVVAKSNGLVSSSARLLAEHADELKDLTREQQQLWLGAQMFAPVTPPEVVQQLIDWTVERAGRGLAMDAAQLVAANDAVAGFDFRQGLPGLQVPTLVVSGRYDVLNPPSDGEELADLLPDATFEVFERSGHLLSWEEPEHYAETLGGFLAP